MTTVDHPIREAGAYEGMRQFPGEASQRMAFNAGVKWLLEMSIDMVLHCPACGLQHIDAPEPDLGPSIDGSGDMPLWNNQPHRSHLCASCGHVWRPADVPTNGVAAVKTHGKADSPVVEPTQLSPAQAREKEAIKKMWSMAR